MKLPCSIWRQSDGTWKCSACDQLASGPFDRLQDCPHRTTSNSAPAEDGGSHRKETEPSVPSQ